YIIREHDVCIENHSIRVSTYLPAASDGETFPLLVWVHGGWVFGTLDQDDYTPKIITVELRMAIVSVDYRCERIPAHHPRPPISGELNDCFFVLIWAAENAGTQGAGLQKRFMVGGQSAGSDYAAVLAQITKADPVFSTVSLTGQALSIPLLCHPEAYLDGCVAHATSLFVQNADAPLLAARHLLDYYGKLQALPKNAELSPLLRYSLDGFFTTYI
ncbi:Alpha/Beta hydrolase protein, partial [Daedaleopsis nitida]